MSTETMAAPQAKWMTVTGWVLSILIAALLTFSGVMKIIQPEGTAEGFAHLGWPINLAIALAVVELGSTLLYLIPGTAGLGAILLTGYLGGAIATHVRIGEAFFVQVLLGVFVWVALLLRDPRLRALIPFRK
jgi:hypothetical protein